MLYRFAPPHISCNLSTSFDVANISSNTWSASNIIKRQLGYQRVQLHQKSQWLPDPSCSSLHNYLPFLCSFHRFHHFDSTGNGTQHQPLGKEGFFCCALPKHPS
eukprot:Gb_14824 [translate_table: standard]